MTTPPSKLISLLDTNRIYPLHEECGEFLQNITFAVAYSLAWNGIIEGIGPRKSGDIKRLRMLSPTQEMEREQIRQAQTISAGSTSRDSESDDDGGPFTINSQTDIGAYRQHLSDGHTAYALCLLRGKGI